MPIKFITRYQITNKILQALMRIEAARQQVVYLPLTPAVLSSLRESARLITTHYSRMIEGNRLDQEQIEAVVMYEGHSPERDG